MVCNGLDDGEGARERLQAFLMKRRFMARGATGLGITSTKCVQEMRAQVAAEKHQQNRFLRRIQEASRPSLEIFDDAQKQWEKGLAEQLEKMSRERQLPIDDRDERKDFDPNLRKQGTEPRYLYDSIDLLQHLRKIAERLRPGKCGWVLNLGLWAPNFFELQTEFEILHPSIPHLGVEFEGDPFLEEQNELGRRLLGFHDIIGLERFLQQGCSAALRPMVYRKILLDWNRANDEPNQERTRRQTVMENLHALDLVLIRNNDNYFVFEDLLQDIMPLLFRNHHEWFKLYGAVLPKTRKCRYPVPFHGLALQVAPLAYLFSETKEIVLCSRELFARFWCQLNTLQNTPVGSAELCLLPNLVAIFESLIQETCCDVLVHLVSIGVNPIDVAFPWIHLGFANVLCVEEFLLLWDRVLGFGSSKGLKLLPTLAAAIFSFRRRALLQCHSRTTALQILNENSKLKAIVLLQCFLFLGKEW